MTQGFDKTVFLPPERPPPRAQLTSLFLGLPTPRVPPTNIPVSPTTASLLPTTTGPLPPTTPAATAAADGLPDAAGRWKG